MPLFLPRWSGLAIAPSAVLGACAAPARAAPQAPHSVSSPSASAPLAPTPSASAPSAPTIACVFDETDVALARPLTLLYDLSPPGALAEYPFARVLRARRLHAEVLVGEAAAMPVRVGVETSTLRLDAVARAADLPLFPARSSTFGGLVVPLAQHPLRWIAAAPDSLTLSLSPMRRATLRAPPESRPCDDLRLRPVPPFEPVELPPRAARRRVLLGPGVWNLYPAPDSRDGPSAAVDLLRGDTVWLLEEGPARWARVLWTTDLAAIVGWVDRRTHVRPALGHGYGTGAGSPRPPRCLRPTTCTADVPLLAVDRGEPRLVGRVLHGASVRVGVADGDRTPVYVCDPDVEWADGVVLFVPSDRAGACDALAAPRDDVEPIVDRADREHRPPRGRPHTAARRGTLPARCAVTSCSPPTASRWSRPICTATATTSAPSGARSTRWGPTRTG